MRFAPVFVVVVLAACGQGREQAAAHRATGGEAATRGNDVKITARGKVESVHTDMLAGGPGDLWVSAHRRGIAIWRGDAVEREVASPDLITELAIVPGDPPLVLAAPLVYEVGSDAFQPPRVRPHDLGAGAGGVPAGARYRIELASFGGDPDILLVLARLGLSRARGAAGGGDAPGFRLMLFDAGGGLLDTIDPPDTSVQRVMLSPHWTLLFASRLTAIDRTSKEAREIAPLHAGTVLDTAFSPDYGRLAIATLEGKVHVWQVDARGFHAAGSWQAHDGDFLHGRATALAFHPTRPLLATGGGSGTIHLWELGDEPPRAPRASTTIDDPHSRPIHVKALAFTDGGATLRATHSHEQAIYSFAVE